jgi:hypothetical protein
VLVGLGTGRGEGWREERKGRLQVRFQLVL